MTSHTRSRARDGRSLTLSLRPLCALLAALPFAALAQDAALQTITVKAPKTAVQPVGAAAADTETLQSGRTASSDTTTTTKIAHEVP